MAPTHCHSETRPPSPQPSPLRGEGAHRVRGKAVLQHEPRSAAKKDLWAGLLLIVVGAAAVIIARNYPFGSALAWGRAICDGSRRHADLFGIAIMAAGLAGDEKIESSWSPRALIILPLSLVLFGILGARRLVPAMLVLIFGRATARANSARSKLCCFPWPDRARGCRSSSSRSACPIRCSRASTETRRRSPMDPFSTT